VGTSVISFPFDLFGSRGAGAGAELLRDAVAEMLADNRRERVPTRARCYQDQVRLRELAFTSLGDYRDWRRRGRAAVRKAWKNGELLFWLAGNHLGALPLYDELSADADGTLVVQFDAHLDVYNLTDCTAELSHGNFLLHAAGPLPPLVNLGHRELLLTPEYVGQFYRQTFPAAALAVDAEPAVRWLRKAAGAARRVVLDIDCDVFDAAYFPALAQPLPFGLSPALVLRLLDAVWGTNVVAVALSEFEPGRDRNDQSLATLLWLVEYLLLRRHE
jgi:arginase family enzyme